MIAQQYFIYLIARGIPGLINFLGLYLFTRLLSPQEYGKYVLVISVVSLLNALIFQWIRLGLLRYYPSYAAKPKDFISTLVTIYIVLCLFVISAGTLLFLFWPEPSLRPLFALGSIIICVQSAFEANLELKRSQLQAKKYGLLALTKSISGLAVGVLFVHLGYGSKGLLCGVLLGYLLPTFPVLSHNWSLYIDFHRDREVLSKVIKYGVPLSATFLLEYVVSSSDRLLLGWLIGPATAGTYAAGYDLSLQTLGLIMSVVNLAAYPLAVRAFEAGGPEKSRQQLIANGTLLFSISIPVATAMVLLAANITHVVLGPSFQKEGALLMPWIVLSALIAGIKAFHFDLSFQLGQKTFGQMWVVVVSAVLNFCLNMWLIPKVGIMGAAYSTFAAYAVGLLLSWILGSRIFKVPVPWTELLKIAGATLVMAMTILPISQMKGAQSLIMQVLAGSAAYAVLAFLLDIGGCKSKFIFWKAYAAK